MPHTTDVEAAVLAVRPLGHPATPTFVGRELRLRRRQRASGPIGVPRRGRGGSIAGRGGPPRRSRRRPRIVMRRMPAQSWRLCSRRSSQRRSCLSVRSDTRRPRSRTRWTDLDGLPHPAGAGALRNGVADERAGSPRGRSSAGLTAVVALVPPAHGELPGVAEAGLEAVEVLGAMLAHHVELALAPGDDQAVLASRRARGSAPPHRRATATSMSSAIASGVRIAAR